MAEIIIYSIAVALEFVFVPLFLKHSWPQRTVRSLQMKMICSALFIICAVCCIHYSGNNSMYMKLLFVGLVLGVLGDLLIHLIAPVYVNILGGVSFFFGHVMFIAAFSQASPDFNVFGTQTFIIEAVILVCVCIFAKLRKLKLGKLAFPVFLYAAAISLMLITATRLGIHLCSQPSANIPAIVITLMLGALLFVFSDSSLAIFMFGGEVKSKSLKVFYIVTYYLAQVLLATSILFIK